MTKRALVYARVSKDESAKTGYSIPTQIEACQKYADQHGFEVIDTITDDLTGSMTVANRLGGARVYEYLNGRAIDAVIMLAIDRTARDNREYPLEFFLFLSHIQDAGAELHFVQTGKSDGGIVDLFNAWRASKERHDIVERTTRGKRASARAGNIIATAHLPYGYKICRTAEGKRGLEPHETEAEIVKMIFQWYTQENIGTHIIAQRLDALGIATPGKSGRGWAKRTISRILKSKVYIGLYEYAKISDPKTSGILPIEPIPISVPALIDQDTFSAAQAQLERNRKNGLRPTEFYLLRGRVFCGECGTAMWCQTQRNKTTRLYYVCPARYDRDYAHLDCPQSTHFRADYVDKTAWQEITQWLLDPARLFEAVNAHKAELDENAGPIRNRLAGIETLLKQNQEKLGRILELYLAGEFSKDLLQYHKDQTESAIKHLEAERRLCLEQLEAQTLTDEQLESVQALFSLVAGRLPYADEHPEARGDVIKALELEARLYVKDGEQYVKLISRAAGKDVSCPVTQSLYYVTRQDALFMIDVRIIIPESRRRCKRA